MWLKLSCYSVFKLVLCVCVGGGVWREVFVDVHACVYVFMWMSGVNLRCCPLDIIFFFFK